MVEFCRHCGEPLHTRQSASNPTLVAQWIHYAIDVMFWFVDESVRWWEIGKLSVQLKSLRRQRALVLGQFENEERMGLQASLEEQQILVSITEELARLSGRDEFLRSRCWAMTPELLFVTLFAVFLYGLIVVNPGRTLLPRKIPGPGVFNGQVSRVRDLPFSGHSVITVAEWFDNKLYVGGDGGLSILDPVSGLATRSVDLPEDFFVRDVKVDANKLIVGGFPGIYVLENTILKPYYLDKQLPVKLVNSLAVAGQGNLLIGTVGHGMLRGDENSALFVLGTQKHTIKDFGRLGNELWIMHEDGILTGRGSNFEPLNLQVLAGRHLRCMVTTDRNVFVGTDQGVVVGYRNSRNWVWTMLSAGKPGYINDLIVSGDILFIASDEGVYRFNKGRMDRLSAIQCHALAIGDSFLAAVNTDSIMFYYFSPAVGEIAGRRYGPVPEIGTFTPVFPFVSMPPLPRLQYARLPDFGLLETDDKIRLTESVAASESFSPGDKPCVSLPSELQKPIFSDILKFDSRYLLATENRGVWAYDGENWSQIRGIEKSGHSFLACNASSSYAYGASIGIFRVNGDVAVEILGSDQTSGLLNVFVEADDTLSLLFSDGSIKTCSNGQINELSGIPGDFKGEFHSLWKINGRYLVVVDNGVLLHESGRQWNLIFFKGSIDSAKVVAVTPGKLDNLYVALNDGRIFEFVAEKLEFTGVISDQPVALNFDGFLWVAGRESLYFLEKNNFVPAPFRTADRILGAFPVADSKSIMVFTGAGVNLIAGRQ